MKWIFLLFFSVISSIAFTQKVEYSEAFLAKLEAIGAQIATPLDSDYKDVNVWKEAFQPYDFAMKSRKEKLEIRYFIEEFDEQKPTFFHPHLRFTRFLMNLAGNEENSILSVHDMETTDLQEEFQADWGKVAFFHPKKSFSPASHCKLLCLYKENQGIIYVLFLFDEPTSGLDNRFYAVQFQ